MDLTASQGDFNAGGPLDRVDISGGADRDRVSPTRSDGRGCVPDWPIATGGLLRDHLLGARGGQFTTGSPGVALLGNRVVQCSTDLVYSG